MTLFAEKRRLDWRLPLLIASVLVALAAAPARAVTFVNACPATLNMPGETYVLAADLICAGTAITITANDVTFRLNGHTLTGNGSGNGILVQAHGVSIFGPGTVQGFSRGIQLQPGATGNTVKSVTVIRCEWGILLIGSGGLASADNTVMDNTVSVNVIGIILTRAGAGPGAVGNTLRGNTVNANRTTGIFVQAGSTANDIHENSANNNRQQGIFVAGDGNTFRANSANNNALFGILQAGGAAGNTYLFNQGMNNGSIDMVDGNVPNCVNTWRFNTFASDNEGDGPGAGCIR